MIPSATLKWWRFPRGRRSGVSISVSGLIFMWPAMKPPSRSVDSALRITARGFPQFEGVAAEFVKPMADFALLAICPRPSTDRYPTNEQPKANFSSRDMGYWESQYLPRRRAGVAKKARKPDPDDRSERALAVVRKMVLPSRTGRQSIRPRGIWKFFCFSTSSG